jgi:hypothetical protein
MTDEDSGGRFVSPAQRGFPDDPGTLLGTIVFADGDELRVSWITPPGRPPGLRVWRWQRCAAGEMAGEMLPRIAQGVTISIRHLEAFRECVDRAVEVAREARRTYRAERRRRHEEREEREARAGAAGSATG